MPRKGRGGARTGTPGKSYTNRSDLNGTQAVKVAPSAQYGQGVQQAAAQKAIPLPDNTGLPAPQPAPQPGAVPAPNGPLPGELGSLDRATERPGEHVSTGMPIGPGSGPEVLSNFADPNAQVGIQLRALYQKTPNQDLLDLIQAFDANQESAGR